MLGAFFRSEWFKLVLALSILGGIVGLLYYAQYQAKIEEAEYEAQKKLHPTSDNVIIDNYELKEVDDSNKVRWLLAAKKGVMVPDTKDVNLTGVNMEYYDGDVVKMKVVAPIGVANEKTRKVSLKSDATQKVLAEGEAGKSRLETSQLELEKKNQFKATGGVNIVWAGVAKVTGNYATGRLGKADLEDLKIIGNTHAIIESQ